MSRVSLGAAAEQTKSFMRREGSLVLPVAFATFGLALIILSLVTPERTAGQEVQPGLWSLAIVPLMFLSVIGQLAISYLVLRPGVTVREALFAAMKRLPTALAVILLLFLAFCLVALILILILSVVVVALGAGAQGAAALGALAAGAALILVGARLLMAWPLIAERNEGPMAAIKQSLALSKGYTSKFILLALAFGLVYVVLTGAVQLGLGSFFLILGKLAGAERAALFLTAIIVALLAAAIQAFWAVLLANIYRQLTGPVVPARP